MTSKMNSYQGLRGDRTYRYKYLDCQHIKVCGISVRLLSQKEVEEFRFHVEQVISQRLPKKVSL